MFPPQPNIMPVWDTTDFTDSGTIGYATRADPKKGQKVVTEAVERMVAFIEKVDLLKLS
jgi:creatinine amidohydrolase/Fe(II)-dependent formamide hydrolase-like protein